MDAWKQAILNRIGLPNLSEELFNKAWDICHDFHESLTKTPTSGPDARFLRTVINIAVNDGMLNTPPIVPPPMSHEERLYLDNRFHNDEWKFFLDHPADKSTEQEVEECTKKYHPYAVKAVLYGYDPYMFVSPEVGGVLPSKSDWKACIAHLDKYIGFTLNAGGDIVAFRGRYGVFSNFSTCEVFLDGKPYPTVENAFQAAKTLNPEERVQFQTCAPNIAKRLGRNVKLRPDWERAKHDIMLKLLLQKFAPGTPAMAILESTGNRYICECNTWHDNYWGDCTCGDCTNRLGKNVMGKMLMRIRNMSLLERSRIEGVVDRYAIILPQHWSYILDNKPNLCKQMISFYRVTGILVEHHERKTLYHCCSRDQAGSIMRAGFRVGAPEDGTYGGDVVYAWEDTSLGVRFPGDVWLAVTVSDYMRAAATVDKPDNQQNECIFLPNSVLSVELI